MCSVPSGCDRPLKCKERQVRVWGYLDYNNVFDRKHFPHLPYQKFVIRDRQGQRSLEVWVQGSQKESDAIFRQIGNRHGKAKIAVVLSGKIERVKLFTNKGPECAIKVVIGRRDQIKLFEKDN